MNEDKICAVSKSIRDGIDEFMRYTGIKMYSIDVKVVDRLSVPTLNVNVARAGGESIWIPLPLEEDVARLPHGLIAAIVFAKFVADFVSLDWKSDSYNAFYRKKPNKWASDERNGLAVKYIQERLGRAPASLIDVGCGIGHSIEFMKQVWPKTRFAGIDSSPVGIQICQEKMPDTTFRAGLLGDAFGIGTFEVVMLLGVLEHIEDTHRAMHEMKKLLAFEGLIYIEVPNCLDYTSSDGEEGFKRINVGNKQVEWHRSRENWERIFKECDLQVVEAHVGPRQEYEFLWILEEE